MVARAGIAKTARVSGGDSREAGLSQEAGLAGFLFLSLPRPSEVPPLHIALPCGFSIRVVFLHDDLGFPKT